MPILATTITPPPSGGGGGGGGGTVDPGTGGGGDGGIVVINPGTGDTGGSTGPTAADLANPAGATFHTLTASNGATWDLQDRNHAYLMVGRRGYDSPQYQVYSNESPGIDGEIFSGARATGRDMIVPLYLRANTRGEFLERKRALLSALSPRRGMATISVAEQDGSRRWIKVFFSGRGGEGDWTRDQQGRTWAKYVLEFRAPDPYWRGDAIHMEFSNGASNPFFPFLPLRVSSGTTLGSNTISVPGEVEAFPTWTVSGPTSGGITLRYTPVGGVARDLLLNSVLQAGDTLTINTDPTKLTILDQTGANRWADLLPGSGMWPLPPGPVVIQVTAGGTAASTKIALDFEPRYESV